MKFQLALVCSIGMLWDNASSLALLPSTLRMKPSAGSSKTDPDDSAYQQAAASRRQDALTLNVAASLDLENAGGMISATGPFHAVADEFVGTIAFLVPSLEFDKESKFGEGALGKKPTYWEAAQQLAKKSAMMSDARTGAFVYRVPTSSSSIDVAFIETLKNADIVVAMGLESNGDLSFAQRIFTERSVRNTDMGGDSIWKKQGHFAVGCATAPTAPLFAKVGPYMEDKPSLISAWFPWTEEGAGKRFFHQMQDLFSRWTTDDAAVAFLLFFNRFSGHSMSWVEHTVDLSWDTGVIRNLEVLKAMQTKCGATLWKGMLDEECRTSLLELNKIDTRDQVASYRIVVESDNDAFHEFCYHAMQKHNIYGCKAEIPVLPNVQPMSTWRNQPLTHDVARTLLVGHMEDGEIAHEDGQGLKDLSWKVAAGVNVIYDTFPIQNMLFYQQVNKNRMAYDCLFQIETSGGERMWRKRHYNIHNDNEMPGVFHFSILADGIFNKKIWTILDAADDLSWIIFHYAGAVSVVGHRYTGGLLCTADGSIPAESELPRIYAAFQAAGVESWEILSVRNDSTSPVAIAAGPAPLDHYLKPIRIAKAAKTDLCVT